MFKTIIPGNRPPVCKASKKLLKHQLILDEYKDPCSDDGIYYDARAQQQAQEAITELLLSLDCVTHKYDELIARHATVTETDGHKSLQLFRRKTFCHRMQAATDSKLCAHDSTGVTYPMPWTLQEDTLYKDWTSLKGLTGNFACLQSRTMSVADMNRIFVKQDQLLQSQRPTGERFNPDTVDVSLIDVTYRYLMSWSFAAQPEIELQRRHRVIFL